MAAVGERPGSSAGVLDLYRALVDTGRRWLDVARRRRLAIAVEISLIVLYVALRTLDTSRFSLQLWTIATAVVAVVSPTSGLVVLAAIAPFSEPLSLTRNLGVRPVIVVAIGAGALIRAAIAIARWRATAARGTAARAQGAARPAETPVERARRWLPIASAGSALALLIGTGLGVLYTRATFSPATGELAAQFWISGIGAGLIVFLAAIVVGATSRTIRPLVVAVASSVLGAAVSLADFLDPSSVRGAAIDWLLRPDRISERLTGIIPSPNGVAALLVVPTSVLIAVAVLGRDLRLRVVTAAAALLMAVTLYYTYSRAALIALVLIAIVVAWRIRRSLGVALLVVSIIGGVALLPTYLQARYQAVGEAGAVAPGQLFIASDAARFTAWGAAIQMFEDRPLTGQGFLSYQVLHESYGDPILRSPHNEWLRLFAEEGIVVGLLGLAFIVTTAGALAGCRGLLGAGALGGFLGFVTAATFNNPFLFVQVMAIACTIVGIVVGRSLASARGTPIGAVPGLDAAAAKHVQPRDDEREVDHGERAQERE